MKTQFSNSIFLIRIEHVLLTLWIGGLWVVGYLVTPTIFAVLENRQMAGNVAGHLFQSMNYIGLGTGIFLLISVLWTTESQKLKEWRVWVLTAMLLVIAIAAFIIQPAMQDLKAQGLVEGSTQATQFGRLHGISSILFILNSVLGLLLVVFGLRKKSAG